MTTDSNGYAKSQGIVVGTYYVKKITAPRGYVLSGKVQTLIINAGRTTAISATDKEQLGTITSNTITNGQWLQNFTIQFENFRIRKLMPINALNFYITLCMSFLAMISDETEKNALKVSIIKTANPVKEQVFLKLHFLE